MNGRVAFFLTLLVIYAAGVAVVTYFAHEKWGLGTGFIVTFGGLFAGWVAIVVWVFWPRKNRW